MADHAMKGKRPWNIGVVAAPDAEDGE